MKLYEPEKLLLWKKHLQKLSPIDNFSTPPSKGLAIALKIRPIVRFRKDNSGRLHFTNQDYFYSSIKFLWVSTACQTGHRIKSIHMPSEIIVFTENPVINYLK